jgi:FUS-interacting serine-arginine-rich protein 1
MSSYERRADEGPEMGEEAGSGRPSSSRRRSPSPPIRRHRSRSRSRSPPRRRRSPSPYGRSPPRYGYRDHPRGGPPPRDYGPPPPYHGGRGGGGGYDDRYRDSYGPPPPPFDDYRGPPPPHLRRPDYDYRGGGRDRSPPRYPPPPERRRGRDEGPPGVSLLVRNIGPHVSNAELAAAFGRIGELRDVYIPRDYHTNQPRGFAFIEYADARLANEARDEMDRFLMKGRELEVVFAQERRKTPGEMKGRVVNQVQGGRGRSSSFERHRHGQAATDDKDEKKRSPSPPRNGD